MSLDTIQVSNGLASTWPLIHLAVVVILLTQSVIMAPKIGMRIGERLAKYVLR